MIPGDEVSVCLMMYLPPPMMTHFFSVYHHILRNWIQKNVGKTRKPHIPVVLVVFVLTWLRMILWRNYRNVYRRKMSTLCVVWTSFSVSFCCCCCSIYDVFVSRAIFSYQSIGLKFSGSAKRIQVYAMFVCLSTYQSYEPPFILLRSAGEQSSIGSVFWDN